MKKTFYVSAIYTSPPNTMGGNTKIMIEMINNLLDMYTFVVFTTEPETFKKNIPQHKKIVIVPIPYPFTKFSYLSHKKEIEYVTKSLFAYFDKHTFQNYSFFYSCSDFAPDVLPLVALKKKFTFTWIASLYLFIPTPIENLKNKYKFPFFKYIIYYFYQRFIYRTLIQKADLFFITNDFDRKYFPKLFTQKIIAMYGGVNSDQILKAIKSSQKNNIKYDAVFCSRLHPQKGINQLLDMWKEVIKEVPSAMLAIIGNGEPSFERELKAKATTNNLNNNIEWLGYVNNTEKYEIYRKSKFLIHATVYDNNGMVAAEALSIGLPVLLYDLPQLKKVYTTGCVKVPIGNSDLFIKRIIQLLTDKKYYAYVKLTKHQIHEIRDFWEWSERMKSCLNFLQNYERSLHAT